METPGATGPVSSVLIDDFGSIFTHNTDNTVLKFSLPSSVGIHSETQVVQLPIVDFLKPRPPFLPVSIPSELAERLEKLHGEPHVWWVGQFMKYILRPQPHVQQMLDEAKAQAGIQSPVVG
jgi:hypothetical protein